MKRLIVSGQAGQKRREPSTGERWREQTHAASEQQSGCHHRSQHSPRCCVWNAAQLPPRGDAVWVYREKEREQGGRPKEEGDYAHTLDWSLKRLCSVQLGSTSLGRT